jgi:hypothetical protein
MYVFTGASAYMKRVKRVYGQGLDRLRFAAAANDESSALFPS